MSLLGASTLFAWHEGKSPSLYRAIEERKGLMWEIVDDSRLRVDDEAADKLRVLRKEHGIRFSVHTPFLYKDVLASDRLKREESRSDIHRSLELANRYEAEYAVIHPGYRNDNISAEEILEVLTGLLDHCEQMGIVGLLENLTSKAVLYRPEDLYALKRALKGARFVFDVGHANMEGTLEPFLDAIREMSYFHVHDNNGKNDDHFRLGKGSVNWELFFSKVVRFKPEAPIVIENVSLQDLDESLQFALKRLS